LRLDLSASNPPQSNHRLGGIDMTTPSMAG
jgi:hypothetical protein